jgi:replicative superfamily II helicase
VTEVIRDTFPEMTNQEMLYYITEIGRHPNIIIDYFDYNDTYLIQVDITTKKFIEKGGFSKIEEKKIKKEEFEFELAKSNLAANKLNKKIAKRNLKNEKNNKVTTWINIVLGIINIGLLIWQVIKA